MNLYQLIMQCPEEIERMIYNFIFAEDSIEFRPIEGMQIPGSNKQIAQNGYIRNDLVWNRQKGVFLSRIWKSNGKHRYYIRKQITHTHCSICDDDCCHPYCRGSNQYEYSYKTKYVGKKLRDALVSLHS
jgi:hypothetical protein